MIHPPRPPKVLGLQASEDTSSSPLQTMALMSQTDSTTEHTDKCQVRSFASIRVVSFSSADFPTFPPPPNTAFIKSRWGSQPCSYTEKDQIHCSTGQNGKVHQMTLKVGEAIFMALGRIKAQREREREREREKFSLSCLFFLSKIPGSPKYNLGIPPVVENNPNKPHCDLREPVRAEIGPKRRGIVIICRDDDQAPNPPELGIGLLIIRVHFRSQHSQPLDKPLKRKTV
ncbi:hypothetical protein AAY473_013231 [Plecturocebus cupreus]